MADKVCPLVLRNQNSEILLFKHPLAGIQLVKGTVESFDGDLLSAAKRELAEESGIDQVKQTSYLGRWESEFQEQVWHFVLCECGALPEQWVFHTKDDGGHHFAFFWHDITQDITSHAHPVFQRALEQVREFIRLGKIDLPVSERENVDVLIPSSST
ncbi:NUDIX hydrolase [Vibrio rotiferianus]|uniref:NUDIX hydrolase n=1 Tax=Vibrio rotiferianus TaxID=190895 RepID=UPI0024924F43|nr:NUDIX domain-containing protein [Vibrio rotiferianus]